MADAALDVPDDAHPEPDADPRARRERARLAATRFLMGAEPLSVPQRLRALADAAQSQAPDVYGVGGEVTALESELCDVLGTEAAVLMPSGTMAQQCALRVWADRSGRTAVAVHGLSHMVLHEEAALEALHGVRMEVLTRDRRPLQAADLAHAPGPHAALSIELPLRDAGYLLPEWDDLVALVDAARAKGMAIHLDGARLWESQPFYGRTHAEIAALADTVYVSFYKGLDAVAGAALAGPADVIADARAWQHRHGGRLYTMHPLAIGARQGLARLGEFGGLTDRARELAGALTSLPGVRVHPDPPQVNAFVLHLDVDAEAFAEQALLHAERTGTWTFGRLSPSDVPGWSSTEVVVGAATLGWDVGEVTELTAALLRRARGEDAEERPPAGR